MYFLKFVPHILSFLNQNIHVVYLKIDLFKIIFLFFPRSKTSEVYHIHKHWLLFEIWKEADFKQ